MKRSLSGPRTRGGAGRMAAVGLALGCMSGCGPDAQEARPFPEEFEGTREVSSYGEDGRARDRARKEQERLDTLAQLDKITRSLAHRKAEQDRRKIDREAEDDVSEMPVLSVDARWGWVLLEGGADRGLLRGQMYGIFRGEHWVARVRVAEVREQVSGAWVEEMRSGWTPAPGDRAVRERRER